jgi:hypothetical protein
MAEQGEALAAVVTPSPWSVTTLEDLLRAAVAEPQARTAGWYWPTGSMNAMLSLPKCWPSNDEKWVQ